MLKKISILAFVAVMAVGLVYAATGSSTASSSTKAADTSTKAATSSKYTKVDGTFVSMDAKAHTITVTVGTDNKTYKYSSHTSAWSGKKAVKLSTLKAGDKVTVSVDSKDNAHKVEVASETATQ